MRRNVALKISSRAPIFSSFINFSFLPLTGAPSLGWKGRLYGGKEKKVLDVLFSPLIQFLKSPETYVIQSICLNVFIYFPFSILVQSIY